MLETFFSQIDHILKNVYVVLSWEVFLITVHLIFASLASLHAMIIKRDPRAALGWVSVSILFPLIGPVLYVVLGINRVKTKAHLMKGNKKNKYLFGYERGNIVVKNKPRSPILTVEYWHYARVAEAVEERNLVPDNNVIILDSGEFAYQEMLSVINNANQYIYLCSYIFETDEVGLRFIEALSNAIKRGVDVKVLIDGIGHFYSRPRAFRMLKKLGVTVEKFNPPSLLPPSININLRNHKKLLIVDGLFGFTGGMNISAKNSIASPNKQTNVDLHFKVEGPVVEQLLEVFCEDWLFVTKTRIRTNKVPNLKKGSMFCRCIADGPSEDLDKLVFILNGMISSAKRQITIITPYFLPNREMVSSLQSAAIRGVDVRIILPRKSNIPMIDWATQNMLWELLQSNVSVFYQPAPFAHTKLVIIDDLYTQIGSANLDPRSLRLNFELNMEILDKDITVNLLEYSKKLITNSNEVSLDDLDNRKLIIRIRDSFFWMFMHYL